jgi:hypothetical protein
MEIIEGNEEDFKKLLRAVLDLDGVRGQVIIVTHSPNTILNDY